MIMIITLSGCNYVRIYYQLGIISPVFFCSLVPFFLWLLVVFGDFGWGEIVMDGHGNLHLFDDLLLFCVYIYCEHVKYATPSTFG